MLNFLEKEIVNKISQEILCRELITITITKKLNLKNLGQDFTIMFCEVIDKFKEKTLLDPHLIVSLTLRSKKELHKRDILACNRIRMWVEKRPDLVDAALDKITESIINIRKDLLESKI